MREGKERSSWLKITFEIIHLIASLATAITLLFAVFPKLQPFNINYTQMANAGDVEAQMLWGAICSMHPGGVICTSPGGGCTPLKSEMHPALWHSIKPIRYTQQKTPWMIQSTVSFIHALE